MKIGDRSYLSRENLEKLFSLLEALGFVRISPEEIIAELKRSGSAPYLKKKFIGRERGYVYRFKNFSVFIWTTFVDSAQEINEHDLVWSGIKDDRSHMPFFWFPIKRTRNFVENTVNAAKMLIAVIHHWPVCPECGEKLYLTFVGGVMHLMKFVCDNHKFVHSNTSKKIYPIFDLSLADEKSQHLEESQYLYEGFRRWLIYEHKLSLQEKPHEFERSKRAERKKQAVRERSLKENFYGDLRQIVGTSDYDDGPHAE